jgi:hypothetical protein
LFFGVEGTPLHHQRRVVERDGVVAAEVAPLLVGGVGEGAAREATRLVAQRLALALARCELQLVHRDDRVVLARVVPAVGQCCKNRNKMHIFIKKVVQKFIECSQCSFQVDLAKQIIALVKKVTNKIYQYQDFTLKTMTLIV